MFRSILEYILLYYYYFLHCFLNFNKIIKIIDLTDYNCIGNYKNVIMTCNMLFNLTIILVISTIQIYNSYPYNNYIDFRRI